jgi:hypothetical protein
MPTKEEIKKFSSLIEDIAKKLDCEYLDAITHHCKETGLEIEIAAILISPTLKSKIREQAEAQNLIKKTSKLPI